MAGIDQSGVARLTENLMEELRGLLDRYCHGCEACGVPLDVVNDYRQFGNWMFLGFRDNANSKIHSFAQTATASYRMELRITDALHQAAGGVLDAIEARWGEQNTAAIAQLADLAGSLADLAGTLTRLDERIARNDERIACLEEADS